MKETVVSIDDITKDTNVPFTGSSQTSVTDEKLMYPDVWILFMV